MMNEIVEKDSLQMVGAPNTKGNVTQIMFLLISDLEDLLIKDDFHRSLEFIKTVCFVHSVREESYSVCDT